MSTPSPQVLYMARQGHPDAIATLMNRHLEAKGITAHVAQQDGVLQVVLEASLVPSQAELVPYVTKGITGLRLGHVQRLSISGKQRGDYNSAWSQDVVLTEGGAQQSSIDQDNGEEGSHNQSSMRGEMMGADLDALLVSKDYNLDRDLSLEPAPGKVELGSILDAPANIGAAPEAVLDFDLDLSDPSDQPEGELDFEQLLSATVPNEPQDLTLDFLLEDSALPAEADIPDDFTLAQETTPDTYLESLSDDFSLDLDWPDQPAEPLSSTAAINWQETGLELDLPEDTLPPSAAEADVDLSTLFSEQGEDQHPDLSDSISDLDPDSNLWMDSVELGPDLETQPLASGSQGLVPEAFDPNLVLPSPAESPNPFAQDSKVSDSPELVTANQHEPWANTGEKDTQVYDWPIEAEAVQNFEADTLNIDSDFSYGLAGERVVFPAGAEVDGVDFEQTEELQNRVEDLDYGFPDSEAEFVRRRDQSLPDLEDFDSISMDVESDVDLEEDGLDLPSIDFASASPYYRSVPSPGSTQTNGFLYEARDVNPGFSPEEEEPADEFIHKFAPVADREVDQLSSSGGTARSWLKILAGLGFGILALLLAMMGLKTLRTLRTPPPAPVVVLPQPGSPPAKPSQPESGDIFRDAVNAATTAANLTQTAKTAAEWKAVANYWSQAINLMKQVPSSHPKYAVAQAKAVEYQTNLTYAQENLRRFP